MQIGAEVTVEVLGHACEQLAVCVAPSAPGARATPAGTSPGGGVPLAPRLGEGAASGSLGVEHRVHLASDDQPLLLVQRRIEVLEEFGQRVGPKARILELRHPASPSPLDRANHPPALRSDVRVEPAHEPTVSALPEEGGGPQAQIQHQGDGEQPPCRRPRHRPPFDDPRPLG